MKMTRIALLALLLSGALAGAGSAATSVSAGIHIGPSGRATVDLGFFYDDLASYGNWVERPQYGWVWTPRAAATTWRPYQNGHWAATDEGWTWITDEPYGWATYHYGRWYDDPEYGWEWVPGNEYAPAWVSWHEGGDYIGWAPLPPSVSFRAGLLDVSLAPDAYVFVPERQFLAPRIVDYVVPRQDCERVYRQTRNFTEYQVVNQRVVNRGVPVDRIQQVVGRPVPRYRVAEMNADQRHHGARIAQNQVTVFRPQVQQAQVAPPPQRPAARRAVMTAPPATPRGGRANRAAGGPAAVPMPPTTQGQQGNPGRHHQGQAEQGRPAVTPVPQAQPQERRNRQPRPAQDQNPGGNQNQQHPRGRNQRAVADPQPPQPQPQGQAARRQHQQPPAADQPPPPANRRQQREQQNPQPQPQPQDQNRHQGRGQGQGQAQGQNRPQGQGQGQGQNQQQPHGQGQGKGHNKPKDNGDNRPPL
jgi:hypothetical protein